MIAAFILVAVCIIGSVLFSILITIRWLLSTGKTVLKQTWEELEQQRKEDLQRISKKFEEVLDYVDRKIGAMGDTPRKDVDKVLADFKKEIENVVLRAIQEEGKKTSDLEKEMKEIKDKMPHLVEVLSLLNRLRSIDAAERLKEQKLTKLE